MTIVTFFSTVHDPEPWRLESEKLMPDVRFLSLEEAAGIDEDSYAIVLYPPRGALAKLPRLKGVLSIAAGVDHILADPAMPDVPIYRQTDVSLQQTMIEYAFMAVLMLHRDMHHYLAFQPKKNWQMILPLKIANQRSIGILGLGNLGQKIATKLADFGFQVHGWSRSQKSLAGITTYYEPDGLTAMLPKVEILLNVLPLTDDTRGLLNKNLFDQLPKGAGIINIGRGGHLNEAELIDALDSDQICAAILDVTHKEPMPKDNPLWLHENVIITPHIAGDILMETAIPNTFHGLQTLLNGKEPKGRYQKSYGY